MSMNSFLNLLISVAFLVSITSAQTPNNTNNDELKHPGLSMSLDLSVISQAKDVYLSQVLKKVNGLKMPNITLSGGDGYVKNNRVFIKQKAKNVYLTVNETRDSFAFRLENLYLFMRSQDFKYNMWFVPIRATLDVEIGNVALDFEVEMRNTTVYWLNPNTGVNETRVIPQIQVPKCVLKMDPKKIQFNIGGSIIAQVADVILPLFTRIITKIIEQRVKDLVTQDELPSMFNDPIKQNMGFTQIGDMLPKLEWANTTIDMQVSRFGMSGSQVQIAFNSTVFNNLTTGYRVLPVPLPLDQPFHDNNINSTWQLFISTYLLEHLTTTVLDESPYEFYFVWDFMSNPNYWLTTTSMECFFPFLTSQYGFDIPIDLNFQVPRVWNFRSNLTDRRLSFNMDMKAQAFLHMPDGSRQYFGMLEWFNGEAQISIFSQGMLLIGSVTKFEFEKAFSQTEYGIARYETTPFLMNIAFYGGIGVLNDDYLAKNLIEVPQKWGYFELKDLYLNYHDNYIALGITPQFKKYNASDFNQTNNHNNTKPPINKTLHEQKPEVRQIIRELYSSEVYENEL